MDGDVSPPPLKRRRIEGSSEERPSTGIDEDEISIYSWNVNGIAPFVQPTITSFFQSGAVATEQSSKATKASLRDFLRRHKWPTLLFLQEVKINPDDATTIRAVQQAVKRQSNELLDSPDYEAHFCLPSDNYNARGFGRKIYGVCSIVRKDFAEQFVERIRPVSWDLEGRVLVVETKARGGVPKLAIINIYAVNGTDHAYKDPVTGDLVGTRHDRKLQVHALLQKECRELEAAGACVIVAGDLNIARAPIDGFPNLRTFPKQHCLNRADFEARFLSPKKELPSVNAEATGQKDDAASLEMIDTFRYLHPDQKSYTYYPQTRTFGESCDRVDLILISKKLGASLVRAGMLETISERGPSDHVPLYACLDFRDREVGSE